MDFFTVTTVDDWLFHSNFLPYHPRVWPVVQIAVIIGNSNPSLRIFTICRVVGWKRSIRRPPFSQYNDRNDVDEHRNNNSGNDNDDHRRAVETNAGESDGADCYLAPFKNTTIWYVVAAMVEWPRGAELIFLGELNVDLERTGGQRIDKEVAVAVVTMGHMYISTQFLPRRRAWNGYQWTWAVVKQGREMRSRTDYILGSDRQIFQNVAVQEPQHNSGD